MLALLIALPWIATAQEATTVNPKGLRWDPNSESDLAGYFVYESETPDGQVRGEGHYVASIPAGTETYLFPVDHPDGHFYWRLTAFDQAHNESEFSEQVDAVIDHAAPAPPVGCSFIP